MNAKKLIAAAAILAVTGSVFAQGQSEFIDYVNVPSTKTRAEVKAELAQDRAPRGAEFFDYTNVASTKSRADVHAELSKAYDEGVLNKAPEFFDYVNIASTRTRAEVRDEALQAARQAHNSVGG